MLCGGCPVIKPEDPALLEHVSSHEAYERYKFGISDEELKVFAAKPAAPETNPDARKRLNKIAANLHFDNRARAQHVFWNISLLEQVIEDISAEIKFFKSFEFVNEAPAL